MARDWKVLNPLEGEGGEMMNAEWGMMNGRREHGYMGIGMILNSGVLNNDMFMCTLT